MIRPYPYVVAIIQARLGSQRFPRKMLTDLCGKPVLGWVIDRVKMCKQVHQIIVATPDKELVDFAYDNGVIGFEDTQNPQNVLGRYLRCINWCSADIVARITGDCPLIDPELVDNTIKGYLENRVDFSTNVWPRTYPRGMDCEVTHANVLKRIFHLTNDIRYREHVTLYAYEHPRLFTFHSIYENEDFSRLNVSVDTPADLDRIASLLLTLNSNSFNWKEIVEAIKGNGKELDFWRDYTPWSPTPGFESPTRQKDTRR